MITEAKKILIGMRGDVFPVDVTDDVVYVQLGVGIFVCHDGAWRCIQRDNDSPAFTQVKNADGTTTVVVENLRVTGDFTAEESYLQAVNGVNGALMIAPSGRVKNISSVADHLLPTGKTLDADYVTLAQATLKGSVQPNDNGVVRWWFEYRNVALDRVTITRARAIAGDAVYPVSEMVSGLEPGRLYEAVLCLAWTGGDYRSNTVRFSTLAAIVPPPLDPIVVTLDATTVTTTTGHLSGTVTKRTLPITAYFIVWTVGGNYGFTTPEVEVTASGESTITHDVTGLKSATSYFCCLCVTDGTTVWVGGQVQFSTFAATGEIEKPRVYLPTVTQTVEDEATFDVIIKPHSREISYQLEWWWLDNPAFVRKSPLLTTSVNVEPVYTATDGVRSGKVTCVRAVVYYDDTTGVGGATETIKIAGATAQFTGI